MKYDLVIFDLDGTLLNTLEDLAYACNGALAAFGFPERRMDEVRRFIGNGVARLIQRAVPEDTEPDTVRQVLDRFKALYLEQADVHTRPYPGIVQLLTDLRAAGIRVAVNSNKVDAATQLLCKSHFDGLIDLALGERADIPKKPAPDGAQYVMSALNVQPERTLYVGDGDADLLTARNARIDAAWVSWGFRTPAELQGLAIPRSFDTAEALERFILK